MYEIESETRCTHRVYPLPVYEIESETRCTCRVYPLPVYEIESETKCTDRVCIPLLTKTRVRSGAQAGHTSPPDKTLGEIRCIGTVYISYFMLKKTPLKYTTSTAPTALMNYEIDLSNIFTIYFKFNFRIKLFTNDGKKISDCVYFETSFIYVYY